MIPIQLSREGRESASKKENNVPTKRSKIFLCSMILTIAIFALLGCGADFDQDILDGYRYFEQGEYDKAIESYERAIRNGRGEISSYTNLANIYHYIEKNYDEAKQIYEKGLSVYPDDYGLLLGLMNVNLDIGNLDTALSQYEYLAKKNIRGGLGIDVDRLRELMLQSSATEAEIASAFKKIVELNPDDLMVSYRLGAYYLKHQQYDKAIEIYKKVIEIKPELPSAYSQLASAYSGIQDYVNAKKYFEKAKELSVDIPDIFFEKLDKKIAGE